MLLGIAMVSSITKMIWWPTQPKRDKQDEPVKANYTSKEREIHKITSLYTPKTWHARTHYIYIYVCVCVCVLFD